MKREAESLRISVRELELELELEAENQNTHQRKETSMPANIFQIANHHNRVVSLRLYFRDKGEEIAKPLNMAVDDACELAAWLVIAAGMGEHMNLEEARAYFEGAIAEALRS